MMRQRRAAELRDQDLRSRVATQIRGKLGFTNEELLKFGIAPRRKSRRKPEENQGTTPTTPTAPAGSTTPKTE